MAKSNAVKRLERILNDEEYGPKLARLNRADERRVLDLIESKGNARAEILRLDEARRTTVRQRRAAKAAPKVNMQGLRPQALRNIINRVGRRDKFDLVNVRKRVAIMDMPRLQFAVRATTTEIEDLAKLPEDDDTGINPFWYH